MLFLFTVFHLNLAYSSIEEEQRAQVISRCYWPLLRLAKEHNLPFGIEASGFTLETAAGIDPAWLQELRSLTDAYTGLAVTICRARTACIRSISLIRKRSAGSSERDLVRETTGREIRLGKRYLRAIRTRAITPGAINSTSGVRSRPILLT